MFRGWRLPKRRILRLIAPLAALVAVVLVVGLGLRHVRLLGSGPAPVVLVVGDSMATGIAAALRRQDGQGRRFVVADRSKLASALSRPDLIDWPDAVQRLSRELKPTAIVVAIGINDRWVRTSGEQAGPLPVRTEGAFRERVRAMLAALTDAGCPAVWVGLPTMRDGERHRDAARLNQIFREEIGQHGVVRWHDLWEATGGSQHGYQPFQTSSAGRTERLREQDGIHLSPLGYDRIAAEIVRQAGL